MEDHTEINEFPQHYDPSKRGEIRRGTALLTTEERNKLLLKKCTGIDLLMKKYSTEYCGYTLRLIRDEINYVKRIREIENKFIKNQISRLIFEVNLIDKETAYLGDDKETAYLGDPRSLKNALKAIKKILILIIEELNSEIQPNNGNTHEN
ncbi:hypothetical protein KAU33_08820 [Candidatus Dependentiae bacterium]|nr:hypothetical protein [Candidatus Dependentiae bacterium]